MEKKREELTYIVGKGYSKREAIDDLCFKLNQIYLTKGGAFISKNQWRH